jgi:hypothetical protein
VLRSERAAAAELEAVGSPTRGDELAYEEAA